MATFPEELKKLSDKNIIATLRASRLAGGLTQKELASRLCVSQVMVHNIETGKGARAWYRYLPKLLAWFRGCGVTLEFRFTIAETKGQDFENFAEVQRLRNIEKNYLRKQKRDQKRVKTKI